MKQFFEKYIGWDIMWLLLGMVGTFIFSECF